MTTTTTAATAREIHVPKRRADRGPEASALVGETATHFIARTGDVPYVRVVVVGDGKSFSPIKRMGEPPRGMLAAATWPLVDGIDLEIHVSPVGGATLAGWAEALARCSILVVDGVVGHNERHALKLAAVAAVPTIGIIVDGDDDHEERLLRGLLVPYGLDGDGAHVLRSARDFAGAGGVERFRASLTPLVTAARPRLLPDVPLVSTIALASTGTSAAAPTSSKLATAAAPKLFTGRCIVAAKPEASSLALSSPCLPPPSSLVAWLDEENEVVALRKVRR